MRHEKSLSFAPDGGQERLFYAWLMISSRYLYVTQEIAFAARM